MLDLILSASGPGIWPTNHACCAMICGWLSMRCQNYDPFLGTLNIRCRTIIGTEKGTIILTTTHVQSHRLDTEAARQSPGFGRPRDFGVIRADDIRRGVACCWLWLKPNAWDCRKPRGSIYTTIRELGPKIPYYRRN